MSASERYVENEIKLRVAAGAEAARTMLEQRGYTMTELRTLESDQLFDRSDGELRRTSQLLRLRRAGTRATVTYKGPPAPGLHKNREEIEFDVSPADALTEALQRLGYQPGFRYEKYRTKFAAYGEPGIASIDETPIGVFLELEGPPGWVDRTAAALGFSMADYITESYAALYREFRRTHEDAPADMTFEPRQTP